MTIALDVAEQWPQRNGNDFWRNQKGSPMVARLRKRQGLKADLRAAALAAGLDVPDKITVDELHELLGPEPGARLEYDRPSHWPFDDWTGVDIKYANRGTLAHDLTEWLDRGGTVDAIPDWMFERAADLDITDDLLAFIARDWLRFRGEFGLVPTFIECPVVNDALMVAGTADEFSTVTVPITTPFGIVEAGELVAIDKKTSDDCVRPGYMVQLARYANSLPYDPATDMRGDWPQPINKRIGFLAQFQMTSAIDGDASIKWELIPLDIARGDVIAHEVYRLKNVDVSDAFGPPIAAPTRTAHAVSVEQPAGGDASSPASPPANLDDLRMEYLRLSEKDQEAFKTYAAQRGVELKSASAEQIRDALDAITRKKPEPEPVEIAELEPVEIAELEPVEIAEPEPVEIDEGVTIDDATFKAAKERFTAVPDVPRQWAAGCVTKIKLNPERGGQRTERRMEILRGICTLAESVTPDSEGFASDPIVRACLSVVQRRKHKTGRPAELLPTLTLKQARKFAELTEIVAAGNVALIWETDTYCIISKSEETAA